MHPPAPSPFRIAADCAEVTFTFYYSFGGALRSPDGTEPDRPYRREWRTSELSYFIRPDFLKEILVSHFHIPLSIPAVRVRAHREDVFPSETSPFSFMPADSFATTHDSIGPLECTVFANGHMAVVLRLKNADDVPATALVSLLRHPEFSAHGRRAGLTAGRLVEKAIEIVQSQEPVIASCLDALHMEQVTLRTGRWTPLPPITPGLLIGARSRPYVGVLFSHDTLAPSTPSERQEIERFVVAVGRPTPAFVTSFQGAADYLRSGARNVYGAGESIVFIGRRGWCVFDGKDHNPDSFRLGVIETTHFVIMALDTGVRALRQFTLHVHEHGAPRFRQLNIAVNYMTRGFRGRTACFRNAIVPRTTGLDFEDNHRGRLHRVAAAISPVFPFRRAVAQATAFLARARLVSPCEDMSGLLATHLTSHTGRAAVERYKGLTDFDELVSASRKVMANYTAFLRTSSDYLNVRSVTLNRRNLLLALVVLFVTLATIDSTRVSSLVTGAQRLLRRTNRPDPTSPPPSERIGPADGTAGLVPQTATPRPNEDE